MTTMKFFVATLMMVSVMQMSAQERPIREKTRTKVEEYKQRLNLTDEQSEQMKTIRAKYQPELEQIRKSEQTRGDKLRAAAEVADQMDAEVEKVLTPAQMDEWKKIKKEVAENMSQRRKAIRERRGGD